MIWDEAEFQRQRAESDCVCPDADKPGPCNEVCPRPIFPKVAEPRTYPAKAPKPQRCRHGMRAEWCEDCRKEDARRMGCGVQ